MFNPIWATGCMSGTSLDGIDIANLLTDGVTISEFGPTHFHSYDAPTSKRIAEGFGRWPGDRPLLLSQIDKIVVDQHVAALAGVPAAEIIGFHGQTLNHDPDNWRTFQAGSGDRLASITRERIAWDFRTQDMVHGGQGAPLAPLFHFACAKWAGLTDPVVFLNLGGVGNITYVDPRFDTPEAEGALVAFDTGPANAPLNDFMMARLGRSFDKDSELASDGFIEEQVLDRVLAHPYFFKKPPKSLDRNDFAEILQPVMNLSDADAAATLSALPAACVAASERHLPKFPTQYFVCGGGRRNPAMMTALRNVLDANVSPVEDLGLNGDMLEAQAFAYLAVRVLRGLPLSVPGTTGCISPCVGGQISDGRRSAHQI